MARFAIASLGVALLLVSACAGNDSSNEDPTFEADFADNPELDVEEDRAQAAEEAYLDSVDELDEIDTFGDGATTTPKLTAKGTTPKKRAAHGPLSIVQDDAWFFAGGDATLRAARLKEARELGADVVRIFVGWRDVTRGDFRSTTKPSIDRTSPDSYEWSRFDTAFDAAKTAGMRVLVSISSPIPYWASEQPQHCIDREATAPSENARTWCSWKPDVREYAMFVTALGRHLRVSRRAPWAVTMWNEPNASFFLADDGNSPGVATDDRHARGIRYRRLWFAGRKALRKTAGVTTRVFFGDLANGVTTPAHWTTFHHSLCMPDPADPAGSKLPCPDRARKVYASGIAYHPYAQDAAETANAIKAIEEKTDAASAAGRLSAGRLIYLTEHAFLTKGLVAGKAADGLGAPDRTVTPEEQAIYMNRVDHFVYDDPRVRSVAQFLLRDQGDGGWESGFRYNDVIDLANPRIDEKKPSWFAYRMSIDVMRVDADTIEVFGVARSCKYGFTLQGATAGDPTSFHSMQTFATDELGWAKRKVASAGNAKFRLVCGIEITSRVASPR